MKVLITGHTSGIGKAIKDNCPSDYEVRGISRTTGHDTANNLPEVLGFIKEYQPDILFNNAWGDGNQNEIATWFVNRFKKGIMITTGSALGYAYLVEGLDGFYDGLIKQPYMHYSDTKAKLLLEAFMWKLRNRQAKDKEHERLIQHDMVLQQGTGFIGGLARSVRPIITYAFFLLFAVIEGTLLYGAIQAGTDFQEAINILWDEDTKAIFAAIISFWFGSRAIDKNRKAKK